MENKEVEILLVEDGETDIEMTLHSLSECNVCNFVKVASDGREALNLLFPAEGGLKPVKPRVVFLDLKLPKVSGHEVLRRMKADEKTFDVFRVLACNRLSDRTLSRMASQSLSSRYSMASFADSRRKRPPVVNDMLYFPLFIPSLDSQFVSGGALG